MNVRVGDGEPCRHGTVIAQVVCEWCNLEDEIARLKRGDFTTDEVHNICHDLHGKVDAAAFAAGCAEEQRKIYNCAPDADKVKELTRALTWALAQLRMLVTDDEGSGSFIRGRGIELAGFGEKYDEARRLLK